jgi:aconitate hydratase
MHLGVACIIAKSFERIHRNNLINCGIAPLTFMDEGDYDRIDQGDELEIRDIGKALWQQNGGVLALNMTRRTQFNLVMTLSEREREILIAGGKLAYLKNNRG